MDTKFPEFEEAKQLVDRPAPADPLPHSPVVPPKHPTAKERLVRRLVIGALLLVVLLPPTAGFYSFMSGVPLHLLASAPKPDSDDAPQGSGTGVSLAASEPHTLDVTDGVCTVLGIHKLSGDAITIVEPPTKMRPLVLPGSTALDPMRTGRIRARFAPARVIELGQVHGMSRETGQSEFRELRPGDLVQKGQLLGVFYSVDVSSKKNALLDALIQLELDQKVLDGAEAHRDAVPEVFYLTQLRAVEGDRNAINNALSTLRLWDIPQEEIDALHKQAKAIAGNKTEWSKTPEGTWVRGEKSSAKKPADGNQPTEDWGGRVTLRAPFDGVIIEENVRADEMVVDNTVNLFQIADVNELMVVANCPEDSLPSLEALPSKERRWSIRTVGVSNGDGLPGEIAEIGYLIDPNQHTAVIKGYVQNPGKHLRAGQFVSATIQVPPPPGVVEVPIDSVVDDGRQSLIFVQPEENVHRFTMRRVHVVQRFENTVLIDSTPIPESEQLTSLEREEGLLPKQPLLPGERVLTSGALELKAAMADLEEAQAHQKQELAQSGSTSK